MRVFVLWSYFPRYLEKFYAKRPGLEAAQPADQLEALLADYFTWPVYVPLRMRERGHQVEVMIANARPMVDRWAADMGLAARGTAAEFGVVLERVREFRPDVLYIGPMFGYYGARLQELRKHCRRVFTWIAAPLRPFMSLGGIDCVITSHANLARQFRSAGCDSTTMLPAFEARILDELRTRTTERDVEVSFVGTLSWAHAERMAVLGRLVRDTPVRLWVLDQPLFTRSMLRPAYYSTVWSYLGLRRRSEGEVFGMEMFSLLARSLMTVNVHIGIAEGLAGNQRMFEATGAGTVLLSEDAPNLGEMFEPGTEMVPYRDADQLVAKIGELLAEPERAAEIGRRGQDRTLRDHSASVRSLELERIFERAL